MNITKTLFAAASISLVGTAASAAIIGFDFEDANNGWKVYESQGYMFDPSNLNSSTRCADDGPNPKHCFLETTQGDPTVLSPDSMDDFEEDAERYHDDDFTLDPDFDLLAFYINFQGTGSTDDNVMWLYDQDIEFDDEEEISTGIGEILAIQLGELANSFLGIDIYLAGDIASGPLGGDHTMDDQTGYIALIKDGYFEDISSFTWNASNGANNRVDCVIIGTEGDDKGDFSLSQSFANCGPGTTVVPVPASLPLMLSALGVVGLISRRRLSKAA